jgi:hypothetical protein
VGCGGRTSCQALRLSAVSDQSDAQLRFCTGWMRRGCPFSPLIGAAGCGYTCGHTEVG